MPSGISLLYQNYTNDELQTAFSTIKAQMLAGRFTALNGAQKSVSIEWMNLEKQLKEINFELNKRGLGIGTNPPKVVTQILRRGTCWPGAPFSTP